MPADLHMMIAAGDAGSARALVPVARTLLARGIRITAALVGPASAIVPCELESVARLAMGDDPSTAELADAMRHTGVTAVLTGAGPYARIEHRARLAARRLAIPSIAVLDYWFEYHARFHGSDEGESVQSWPDIVCALDETSRAGLVDAGCSQEKIVVTGPTNLEESLHWFERSRPDRRALAERFGVSLDRPIVVFFSEPYRAKPDGRKFDGPAGLYRDDGRPVFGYTAIDMLTRVADVLARYASPSRPPQMIVKSHPLEWSPPLHDFAASRRGGPLTITVLEDANPKMLVALADVVVGMSSVTLLEAALLGIPSFSVQIGFSPDAPFDPSVGNGLGLTTAVFDDDSLARMGEAIVTGQTRRTGRPPDTSLQIQGAAARVADAVVARMAVGSTVR